MYPKNDLQLLASLEMCFLVEVGTPCAKYNYMYTTAANCVRLWLETAHVDPGPIDFVYL